MTEPEQVSRSWTFLAPTGARPSGGDIARFELVNALARRGTDLVRVVHLPTPQAEARSPVDLPWFVFDGSVEHQFATDLDPDGVDDTDVVVYSTNLLSTALPSDDPGSGRRLVDALQGGRAWLPVLFLQGHGVFRPIIEDLALRLPGLKVCVGGWLVDLVVQTGVPRSEVVHIPNGLDHNRFRVRRPIDGRAPRVAMNFDPYPAKRGRLGLAAIELLHDRRAVPATVFGTLPMERATDPDIGFLFSPSQETLAEVVYNEASMFLQPSEREGFGMCAVEAMACGCALVTTANGGSADYAFDGETALLCEGDAEQMAEVMDRLVRDDSLRVRIAMNGSRFVERFRWAASADRLARLVSGRLAATTGITAAERVNLDPVVRQLLS